MALHYIDLNCDLGEYTNSDEERKERAIMPAITSANIACGGHTGDQRSMRRTITRALEHSVAIGAHPSFVDRINFGRVEMDVPDKKLQDIVHRQISELIEHATGLGGRVSHVKAHGALYNLAARNIDTALTFCEVVARIDSDLLIYGLANSQWVAAAKQLELRIAEEVFSDRRYLTPDSLVPRTMENALITSVDDSVRQILGMIHERVVECIDGLRYPINADTICVHGDGDHALEFANHLRVTLAEEGLEVCHPV